MALLLAGIYNWGVSKAAFPKTVGFSQNCRDQDKPAVYVFTEFLPGNCTECCFSWVLLCAFGILFASFLLQKYTGSLSSDTQTFIAVTFLFLLKFQNRTATISCCHTGSLSSAPANLSSFKTGSLIAISGVHPHEPVCQGYIKPNSCQWEGSLCFLQPAKSTFLPLSTMWRCLCSTSFVYKAVLVRFTNSSPASHPSVSSRGPDPNSLPGMAKLNEINCLRSNKSSSRQLLVLGWWLKHSSRRELAAVHLLFTPASGKKTCVLQKRKEEIQNILCKLDCAMESRHFRQLVDSCVVEGVRLLINYNKNSGFFPGGVKYIWENFNGGGQWGFLRFGLCVPCSWSALLGLESQCGMSTGKGLWAATQRSLLSWEAKACP